MDSKEQEPFLPAAERDYDQDQQSSIDGHTTKINRHRRRIGLGLIHAGLFVLYCLATYVITSKNSCPLEELALPGLKVKHQFKLYDKFNESPFAGPPSTEVDEAWHNLMLNMSIRVTKEELDAHGQTSIELPGGGYLAWLGVFHELHCVKLLRRWSYKEHYYPNMTEHEYDHQIVHIDHCIDWLRNAAMCHADTSALAVFKWDKNPKPMLNTKRVPHKCVDWDELLGSHQDRIVRHEEVISLVNPNLISTPERSETA